LLNNRCNHCVLIDIKRHVVEFVSKNGRVLQRTELTPEQEKLLGLLNLPKPTLFLGVIPSGTKTQS
jgi:hypothetical protein